MCVARQVARQVPTGAEHYGLFNLIDDHQKLQKDSPHSNWIWPFRDSVELKARLTEDLRAYSGRAILERLLREGKLPVVTVYPYGKPVGLPGGRMTFNVNFAVVTEDGVFDAVAHFGEGHEPFRLGDVMPKHPIAAATSYPTPEGFGTVAFEKPFSVTYMTRTGVVLEDLFSIVCEPSQGFTTFRVERRGKRLVSEQGLTLDVAPAE